MICIHVCLKFEGSVEELEVEKAKLEQGLHFRKMASIREQADHEQRLQEVQDEKDGRYGVDSA